MSKMDNIKLNGKLQEQMKTIINPYNWLYDWLTKRMLQFSKQTPLVG